MMERVEISAKTTEEALEIALKELGAEREEVAVEVISQGRAGLFGIGAEEAKIRVTRLPLGDDLASRSMGVINQLLSAIKVSAWATIRSTGDDEVGAMIDIQGDDSALIIGKRGESLQAFQFLVNLILNQTLRGHPLVVVDVEGYKERRSRSLEALANRVAERVVSSGHPVTLEPMPAAERRVIHVALTDHPHVTTESEGYGHGRKVTIMPRTGNS